METKVDIKVGERLQKGRINISLKNGKSLSQVGPKSTRCEIRISFEPSKKIEKSKTRHTAYIVLKWFGGIATALLVKFIKDKWFTP